MFSGIFATEPAKQNGDYYPYSKCSIVVFTPNGNEGYHALNTKIDIGDGEQKNLLEHMEKACSKGKDKIEVLESLKSAIKERTNVKDKILIPLQDDIIQSGENKSNFCTQSIEDWKKEIERNVGNVKENEVESNEYSKSKNEEERG